MIPRKWWKRSALMWPSVSITSYFMLLVRIRRDSCGCSRSRSRRVCAVGLLEAPDAVEDKLADSQSIGERLHQRTRVEDRNGDLRCCVDIGTVHYHCIGQ